VQYGLMENILPGIAETHPSIALAGYQKARIRALGFLAKSEVVDSGIQRVNARVMIEGRAAFNSKGTRYPNLPVPLTELNIKDYGRS
jgi:hypothetical protein